MSDHGSGGDALLAFLVGAAVGATFGILFSPDEGKKNRRKLGEWADGMAERGEEFWEENRDTIESAVRQGKRLLDRLQRPEDA